jgi:hypothetical protein
VVGWIRTNLIAGITTARVMAPDGREFPLPARSDALWPLMNLLVSYGLSNPTPVLDLRKRRMRAVAGAVMEVVRDKGRAGAWARAWQGLDRRKRRASAFGHPVAEQSECLGQVAGPALDTEWCVADQARSWRVTW